MLTMCWLSNSVHQAQGGSPSQLFKHADEVDSLSSLTKSARQVGSPSQLTKPKNLTRLTYHLASPSIYSLGSGNHIPLPMSVFGSVAKLNKNRVVDGYPITNFNELNF
jgi:hypothetical protein